MESDDETENRIQQWKGWPGCVILINISEFKNPEKELCLEVVRNVVSQSLKSSFSQLIGLCLYGSSESQTSTVGLQNIIELMKLKRPTLSDLKVLKNLDISKVKSTTDFNLSDVLWQCSRMFANCKKAVSERSVFLISKFENSPPINDQRPTLKRVLDFVNLGISLKFINISDVQYIVHTFYNEMFKVSVRSSSEIFPKPLFDISQLEKSFNQRSHKHLALSRLKFNLSNDVSISVGVYKLSRSEQLPTTQLLYSDTSEAVSKNIKVISTGLNKIPDSEAEALETESPVLGSNMIFHITVGSRRVEFTKEEIIKMKTAFGQPSIDLLGFKSFNHINKEKWFLKSCAFLFPNELATEGSTKLFYVLHKACSEMKAVALCKFCSRVNSIPRLVSLYPVTNPLNLDIEIGFNVIYLPYLENVKDVPQTAEDVDEIDSTKLEYFEDLISKLKFTYRPDMFENPKLKLLYGMIESLALNEDITAEFIDTTKPCSEFFEKMNSEVFENLFGPFGVKTIKRPAVLKNDDSSSKRAHVIFVDELLLNSRLQTEEVELYNVKDLRDILRWKKPSDLPPLNGLKKMELVRLVYKFCSN